MSKKLSITTFSAFFLIIFSAAIAYFVQQVIAFTPNTEAEVGEWRALNNFNDIEWPAESVEFQTFENSIEKSGKRLTISGILIPSAVDNSPTIIALHGKGSNRIGVLRFGYMFYKSGFNVLIYDQRHHGRSEGRFTTYGHYESYDVSEAIDFLESKNIPTDRLGIIGESFGAATSILAGAIDDRIQFVIADSSYVSMTKAVKDNAWRMNYIPHYPIPDIGFAVAGIIANFNPWKVSPINAIKTINKPVLIIHCDLDVWAYPEYAYQLFEASNKESTTLKMFNGCKHVAAYDDFTEEYEASVEEFLNNYAQHFYVNTISPIDKPIDKPIDNGSVDTLHP